MRFNSEVARRVATVAARVLMVVVAVSVGWTARLRAIEPRPLPVFEISTLEGAAVYSSTVLPSLGKWLLVYVEANCRPCDQLLNVVKPDEHPDLASKMVIVVGGVGGAPAMAARARQPNLAAAQWFTDQPHAAWPALQMSGVPVVFGVRDRTIMWTLSGLTKSEDEVESILASWVEE